MTNWRSNLLELDPRREAATEIALARFQKKVSTSLVHVSLTGVIAETGEQYIVRVCYGHDIKPPGRKWYAVSKVTQDAEPLSFDEVQQYGEVPWR